MGLQAPDNYRKSVMYVNRCSYHHSLLQTLRLLFDKHVYVLHRLTPEAVNVMQPQPGRTGQERVSRMRESFEACTSEVEVPAQYMLCAWFLRQVGG